MIEREHERERESEIVRERDAFEVFKSCWHSAMGDDLSRFT